MAKAQINFPDGTTVKLEGTPDEISTVIDRRLQYPSRDRRPRRSIKRQQSGTAGTT
jgi:hypothetical protein